MPVFMKSGKFILYIHIPKCGGHSIEGMLCTSGWEISYRNVQPKNYIRITPQHYHSEIMHNVFNMNQFDYVFTVVRNPIDRFISEFKFHRKFGFLGSDKLNINEWAKIALHMNASDPCIFDNHLRPQYEFIMPNTKIYAFEKINMIKEDIINLFDTEITSLPQLNKGAIDDLDIKLNSQIVKELEKIYSKDFEIWEKSLS